MLRNSVYWAQKAAILVLAVLCSTACAGKLTDTGVSQSHENQQYPGELVLALPFDALKSASLEDADRFCYGADYSAELPNQRVTAQGTELVFQPTWDAGGQPDPDDLAFAMYVFSLEGYDDQPQLVMNWSGPPADWTNCFVGLGNQEYNRWDWFTGSDISRSKLTLESLAPYLDGHGGLGMIVLLTGMDECTLSWLRWGGNVAPIAAVSADPTSGEFPLEVSFDAQDSVDLDGDITLYEWDWNGTGEGPWDYSSGTEAVTQHEYTTPGTYLAWVKVTDNDGEAGTASVQITVEDDDERGDWWMYGRNSLHTRRSPYAGPETNALKWSFAADEAIHSSPAIGANGTIYVGSNDSNLYAINPDGSLKWSYFMDGSVISSPAIAADGTVYVGSNDGNLYAIYPDGSMKWSCYVYWDSVSPSSPAIAADGTVYIGGYAHFYAVNPDGTVYWSRLTDAAEVSSPAVGQDGTVYFQSAWQFYAVNPDGSTEWVFVITPFFGCESSPAVGTDGTVYVGSWDSNLYALNADGTEKWHYTAGSVINSSPAIATDGTIYVGSYDNNLHAINPDGSQKWTFNITALPYTSPAVDASGVAYYAGNSVDYGYGIYAINPDGSLKWVYVTGDTTYSSPAIGSDGTMYVGSSDGKLYAIGPGS